MPSFSGYAKTLTDSLGLTQPPVAVCLTDTVPAGVEMWSGHSPAGCRFWQEAATRAFATVPGDHAMCSIGQYTHNLQMSPASTADLHDALGEWMAARRRASLIMPFQNFTNVRGNRLLTRAARIAYAIGPNRSRDRQGAAAQRAHRNHRRKNL